MTTPPKKKWSWCLNLFLGLSRIFGSKKIDKKHNIINKYPFATKEFEILSCAFFLKKKTIFCDIKHNLICNVYITNLPIKMECFYEGLEMVCYYRWALNKTALVNSKTKLLFHILLRAGETKHYLRSKVFFLIYAFCFYYVKPFFHRVRN